MFQAEILGDSITPRKLRLTTFKVVFPRYLLAEVNTHRMLSKNSASSRAIPFQKMVQMVKTNPYIPEYWMLDHKGMQGADYASPQTGAKARLWFRVALWLAVFCATRLHKLGITKQIANRLLEPFMWHTALVSGTEWENFFALRAHPDAETNFQKLAYQMLHAYNLSEPRPLQAGDWHIPYDDFSDLEQQVDATEPTELTELTKLMVKVGTARNARLSYETLGEPGKRSGTKADLALHDKLLASELIHASPAEHCAQVMDDDELRLYNQSVAYQGNEHLVNADEITRGLQRIVRANLNPRTKPVAIESFGWYGNFRGYKQYRKMLPNENARDSRVLGK